jgi:hypothetical protein
MTGTHASFRVQRRGPIYYYRRRVPSDLRAALARSEIVRALDTPHLALARRRAAIIDAAVYDLFDRMRDQQSAIDEEQLIERLCAAYRTRLIAEDRRHRRRYPGDPEAEWRRER